MEPNTIHCKNCEKPFNSSYKFCPHCGQSAKEEVTLGVLFYNTISNYFSFDARFLKSFLPLMLRPGYLAKKFIQGKRLQYLHPAQMYLFVSVIFFFMFSFLVSDWEKDANAFNQKIAKAPIEVNLDQDTKAEIDSLKREEVLKQLKQTQSLLGIDKDYTTQVDSILVNSEQKPNTFSFDGFDKKKIDSLIAIGATDEEIYKSMGRPENPNFIQRGVYKGLLNLAKGYGLGNIIKRAFDAIPISMFILLPFFAVLLNIFYFNKGRYSYHLVFSFYLFSFLFTVFTILLATNRFLFPIPIWITVLIILSTFIYFYLAVKHFYSSHWLTTFIKSSVITFIFISIVVPISGVVLLLFGFVNS